MADARTYETVQPGGTYRVVERDADPQSLRRWEAVTKLNQEMAVLEKACSHVKEAEFRLGVARAGQTQAENRVKAARAELQALLPVLDGEGETGA